MFGVKSGRFSCQHVIVFGAIAALACAAHAQDTLWAGTRDLPERPGNAVRVASYNVLNLFDDRDDPSLSDRAEDIDDAKPESQKRAVAEAIRAIDADVIGLQEIESFDALIEFREQYLKGLGYDHVVSIDVGQERGIEQAVISRFPIREALVRPNMPLGGVHPEKYGNSPNWYAGEPILFRRSPLRVKIEVPAGARGNENPYEFTMFVLHHKSGGGNDYWREKEAAAVCSMIEEVEDADRNANIVVLGDFNEIPGEESVEMYADEADMTDLGEEWGTSNPTHESNRRIDFMFVNDEMHEEYVEGSHAVYAVPLRPQGSDYRTTPEPEGFASDHLPVIADFVCTDR